MAWWWWSLVGKGCWVGGCWGGDVVVAIGEGQGARWVEWWRLAGAWIWPMGNKFFFSFSFFNLIFFF